MSDTHTFSFTDPKNPQDKYTFTVKSTFLEKCPSPETADPYELETKYSISEYFHNQLGPAMVYPDKTEEYWVDGRALDEQETEKLKHSIRFNNKLEEIISS